MKPIKRLGSFSGVFGGYKKKKKRQNEALYTFIFDYCNLGEMLLQVGLSAKFCNNFMAAVQTLVIVSYDLRRLKAPNLLLIHLTIGPLYCKPIKRFDIGTFLT